MYLITTLTFIYFKVFKKMERLLILSTKQFIMKNILLFLAVSSTILLSSCEGDPGPPGEPGVNILGQVFEFTTDFDYDAQSNSQVSPTFSFPVTVFESDVILVYRLFKDPVDIPNEAPADLWQQLPYSDFSQADIGNIFQYTFNHTFIDIQFVIDGNFDLNTLSGTDFTNDQTFRIAVVPAEFADANLTMEQLMSNPNIEQIEIQN